MMGDKEPPRLVVPQSANSSLTSEIGAPTKRKKVPLRPGHSLADWIRLSKENPGIAKVNRPLSAEAVSTDELSTHNSMNDCWIAIRGKVYNVTPYLDYHPGGAAEILQTAGKDATSAFDEIHTWVNFESLLRACYVAQYAGSVKPRYRLNSANDSSTPSTSDS